MNRAARIMSAIGFFLANTLAKSDALLEERPVLVSNSIRHLNQRQRRKRARWRGEKVAV